MTITPESFIDSFPVTALTRISGLPTYESIKIANDELSANAASVHTELGGGLLGFLAITVSPAIYATVSPTAFTVPTNLVVPDLSGMTGNQIDATNRTYDNNKKKFKEHVALENALKKQLLQAVDTLYLEAIKERFVGFGSRTIWQLLDHLYLHYANILPADLMKNTQKLNAPWDPNQPFEYVIRQI